MTRQTRWWMWSVPAALAMAAVLLLGGPDVLAQKRGGVLRIGNLGEPPTLDAHWTTATLTEVLTNHLYEGLYALDEGYRPIPMLAEALPTISPDGLTYAIRLRQGVKFHNGKEMTSDDVVASLQRWTQQSQYGKALAAVLAEMRATGKYALELKLKQQLGGRRGRPGGAEQLRRDLPEGDRREVPAGREGHRVRRDRAVQARRVEAGPAHPDGPLRRLQGPDRAGERIRRGEGRPRRRDPLDSRSRRRHPRGPDGDGRARVRRRPQHRRLRPAAEERECPAGRGQAVLLARRRLQQEGRPDDEPEAPAGLAGGPRHGARS